MCARNVLITGASGFLGAHVAAQCLSEGWSVTAAVRPTASMWRVETLTAGRSPRRAHIDLFNADTATAALESVRPDVVIHCAAYGVEYTQQDLSDALAINVLGTERLVSASAKCGVSRFIHVGTCYEYGDHASSIAEDVMLRPKGVYGTTKSAATLVALDRAATCKLPLTVVRPFGMYGPLEGSKKLVPLLLDACHAGTPLSLTAGEQVRDYTYVVDAAKAILLIANLVAFPTGQIVNIGSQVPVTLHQLGDVVEAVTGRTGFLKWGDRPYRPDEMMALVADSALLQRLTGWRPTTTLTEGLTHTLNALVDRRDVSGGMNG